MASRNKLTIAMCSSMFSEFNGTSKASRQLAFALARNGHKVHIYAPNKPFGWQDDSKSTKNMFYHEFFAFKPPYSQEFNLPFPIPEIITSQFRKERDEIDVCHAQTPCGMGFYAWAFAKMIKVPKVITAHSPLFFYTKDMFGETGAAILNRLFWVYEPILYNQFDLRVTPTISKKRFLLYQGFKNPMLSLSNGIEDRYFKKGDREKIRSRFKLGDKKVLLYISRLAPEKNQDVILKAFIQIHKKVPNSHFLIAGQGPLKPILEKLISDNNLEDCVTLAGFVADDEVNDFYAAADLTCLWSRVEAQGLVLLEAMAQGTPSLGLNAMGIEDVIVHGKTGFLVNNEKEFIARAIQIFRDDSLEEELRKNCLKYIEAHRMDKIVDVWTDIYNNLLDLYPKIVAQDIGKSYCDDWVQFKSKYQEFLQ